jgi:AraC-like DNA-binding protein
MREPSIAAGFARALMELAVRKGASRKALAEQSGIDPEELQDQDNRIPLKKYIGLMRAGKDLANDPALALHFGEAYDIAELSIVALIGQACETIADGVTQLERFGRLMIDVEVDDPAGRRLVLSRESGQLWLIDKRKNPNEFPEITESSIARMICGSRRMPGQKQFIREVHVTHAAPAYRVEYDRILQVPVVFASDRNAMLMTDDSFLTLRNPVSSHYVFGILCNRAEVLLKELENSKTTRGRVESLLLPALHTGNASMDTIAGKMGLSRQTLFRKLKAEGTSFEKALDGLRHKMALNYLSGKRVSVNETAYLVGFSESAAFSRAFKRWTGTSPRAMRAQSVA